jgi:hypothetical protein
VFFDRHGQPRGAAAGFDAVVGNPPYGFVADKLTQQFLSKQYNAASVYDLYVIFIERAISMIKLEGSLGYITPASWQTGIDYQRLRAFVLKTCHVLQIINLPYDVFPDAYIDTSIYIMKKECEFAESSSLLNRPILTYEFGKREKAQQKLGSELDYFQLHSGDWFTDEQLRFVTDPGITQIRQALGRITSVALGDLTDSVRGVLASDQDLSNTRRDGDWKPYFQGDVYRYQLSWDLGIWIKYGSNLKEMPGSYRYFTGSRLLVRRLINRQFRLMAAHTTEEFVNKKDLYNVILTASSYNIMMLLALLNSAFYSYMYVTQSMMAARDDFPQVTLGELRKLPVRSISFSTPEDERTYLASQATRFYEKDDHEALLSFVEARLIVNAEQSDVVHDLLAYLAQQMMDLHAQRREAIEDFLLDLEGVLSPADLRKISRLWTPSASPTPEASQMLGSLVSRRLDLRDHVGLINEEQWKWLLKTRLKKIASLSDLVRIFRHRHPGIARLDQQIAATDRLIDQIVYRLYDLTSEEIAIIEAATKYRYGEV